MADTLGELALTRLKKMGINVDELDARTVGQLKKIDDAIKAEAKRIAKARQVAAGSGLTISAISKASGISRATFYNKPYLGSFVDEARSELCAQDDAERLVAKEKLDHANEVIERLMDRDGELVLAKADIEALSRQVKSLEDALDEAQSRKRSNGGCRIVPIDKDVV